MIRMFGFTLDSYLPGVRRSMDDVVGDAAMHYVCFCYPMGS